MVNLYLSSTYTNDILFVSRAFLSVQRVLLLRADPDICRGAVNQIGRLVGPLFRQGAPDVGASIPPTARNGRHLRE
jgi:hypothetical protein